MPSRYQAKLADLQVLQPPGKLVHEQLLSEELYALRLPCGAQGFHTLSKNVLLLE